MYGLFWDKWVCGSQTPQTLQILLHILNPLTNMEILAPEVVDDQSEMLK